MAINSSRRLPMRASPGASAPLFGVFLILWLAFAAALTFNQGALYTSWQWLLDLPVVLQVILWVLFLPVAVGLWIWESDWSLWLRLLLIVVIAVGNLAAFGPKPRSHGDGDAALPDSGGSRREAPPGSIHV